MQYDIVAEKLVKRYMKTSRNAVNEVSFAVKKGEIFVLLGPKGAGKTTLLSILSTKIPKTSGKIKICGMDLDKNIIDIRNLIGIIYKNPILDSTMSGEENIRFFSSLYGIFPFETTYGQMPQEYKDRVEELASLVGLMNIIYQPVHTYSLEKKWRLDIMRNLMRAPRILLLDETNALVEPEIRSNFWDVLCTINKKLGITILLGSELHDDAKRADQVCMIYEGQVAPKNIFME